MENNGLLEHLADVVIACRNTKVDNMAAAHLGIDKQVDIEVALVAAVICLAIEGVATLPCATYLGTERGCVAYGETVL